MSYTSDLAGCCDFLSEMLWEFIGDKNAAGSLAPSRYPFIGIFMLVEERKLMFMMLDLSTPTLNILFDFSGLTYIISVVFRSEVFFEYVKSTF